MTKAVSIKVENEQLDKGSVEITKIDKDSQKVLEGVVFEVQDEQGKLVTEVKQIKMVKQKSQIISRKVQISRDEKFTRLQKLTDPVSFEITKGMTTVLSLKVENEQLDKGSVEITKIDKDSKKH